MAKASVGGVPVRGVLLDIDGTLLDSNDAHARSWVEVFRRHGMHIPFERVRPLIGEGGDKLLPQLTGIDAESAEGKALSEERRELFLRDYLPALRPTRGARTLVERLKAAGLRLVVATSSNGEELGALLRQAGVAELIGRATSSDDGASKPDPDIVRAALREADLAPGDVVMVGDTPYDIVAAKRAGVKAIALRCGGWWDDAALAGAAAIYDDPAALSEAGLIEAE
ncbi:MAG TPA: HAD family hydrolase [Burkholderiales bacterium]|nr:HAD family hydrolase [Burkholderiales bacterium]